MTRKRNTASRDASSRAADDLKRITGIGPAFEKSLQDAGIRTFAQLAQQSPEDVATLNPKLSAGHIRAQRWIPQARKLASKGAGSKSIRQKTADSPPSQHYENFTLEFLLTEKNIIRRVRIVHIQSGDVDSWTSWNTDEVSSFLARHTKARFPKGRARRDKVPASRVEKTVESRKPLATDRHGYLAPITFRPAAQSPKSSRPKPSIAAGDLKAGGDQVRLLKWINSTSGSNNPVQSLSRDQIFDVNLTLDIGSLSMQAKSPLDITGTLFAKKLGTHERRMIGETQMVLPFSPTIDIRLRKLALEQGLYRLEAHIRLDDTPTATLQGGLFQVY